MKLLPAKTPELVKSIFPNFIWNIDTTEKELYLTFDDGPTPEVTDWVLEQLTLYNAKATFFCIGSNIEKNPGIFKRIIESGNAIGNHTKNHLKGWKTSSKEYLEDVKNAQKAIEVRLANPSTGRLFRPPYGKLKSKQSKALQKLGYKIVLWDVLSFDWDATVNEETCLNSVLSSAKEGSIIVFHDSKKAQRNLMYALPKVLDYYSNKGFTFKAIDFEKSKYTLA